MQLLFLVAEGEWKEKNVHGCWISWLKSSNHSPTTMLPQSALWAELSSLQTAFPACLLFGFLFSFTNRRHCSEGRSRKEGHAQFLATSAEALGTVLGQPRSKTAAASGCRAILPCLQPLRWWDLGILQAGWGSISWWLQREASEQDLGSEAPAQGSKQLPASAPCVSASTHPLLPFVPPALPIPLEPTPCIKPCLSHIPDTFSVWPIRSWSKHPLG